MAGANINPIEEPIPETWLRFPTRYLDFQECLDLHAFLDATHDHSWSDVQRGSKLVTLLSHRRVNVRMPPSNVDKFIYAKVKWG